MGASQRVVIFFSFYADGSDETACHTDMQLKKPEGGLLFKSNSFQCCAAESVSDLVKLAEIENREYQLLIQRCYW